ncbi:hypothetical protein DSECCO2_398870 [anaerobic digester metagenome]
MIAETLKRIAARSATNALLAAELGIDAETLAQRLEMLEWMGYLTRAPLAEEGCGSTGACRGCPWSAGGKLCRKETSFLILSPKGVAFTGLTPRREGEHPSLTEFGQ